MTGEDVVKSARSYIGIPFRTGGRNRHGMDCGGLIAAVCDDIGVAHGDAPPGYTLRMSSCALMRRLISEVSDLVPRSQRAPGDFALFRIEGRCHAGVLTGAGIVHAWIQAKRIVESPLDDDLVARMTVWRVNGLEKWPN